MAQDIFAIRAMVADAERAADAASRAAVEAGSKATDALHSVRAAIRETEEAIALVRTTAERGEQVQARIKTLRAQQKLHPDLEQAVLGADTAQTSMEESLSNLLHLKDALDRAHEVATRSGFPVGTLAPAQYRGTKMWLDRWVRRL